jgi:hypothetical protein
MIDPKGTVMFRTIGLGLLLCAWSFAPAAGDSILSARGELEQRVRAVQEAGNCKAARGLFYTSGMDKVRKRAFVKSLEDDFCENFDRKIASIAFQSVDAARQEQPADFGGRHSAYTLEPQGAMVVDFGEGDGDEAKSVSFLYGMNDGKAYLLATKNAEPK